MSLAAAHTELGTERLLLRPLSMADAEGLHAVYSNPEAMRYWSSPPSRSLRETGRWVREDLELAATGSAAFWSIRTRADDAAVGKFTLIHYDAANRRVEIGFILLRELHRRGLMTEAASAVLDHSFGELGLHRLEADTDPDNTASIALLRKLGFREEGRARERWKGVGEWRDSLLFGLLAKDWVNAQSSMTGRPRLPLVE